MKVVFAGEPGAFSEIAAFKFFKEKIKTLPCKSFKEVLDLVEKGNADFGILPIENSIAGAIGENYDLLLKSKLKIFGEEILKISHCLIVNRGVSLKSLKNVYSHPQALMQSQKFIEKMGLIPISVYNTAAAVKILKNKNIKDGGAIASERAASLYKMKILKKGIETTPKNFTRFFIIAKRTPPQVKKMKTSIVFSLKHRPKSLFNVLEIFAQKNINLTKIESRPIIGKPWEYNFYLDFIGSLREKKIKKALKELRKKTIFFKALGSYPQAGGKQ
ncbi:prephenate dehydratase [Candidatus Kuenenbacteria bacterium]|nr:prephenate dehydratase [Candidatus Kuenenbacteria bacterium]